MGQIYHCGCLNDQYLSPYQTRGKWLPWLLRKSRPFIFVYRPLGPIYFNIWGIFTIMGVWMIITYHHTKPEPIGCLGCWEKAGPLYFNIGPWGPHTSNYGAFTIVGVWMITTYHHTKPEPRGCLGCWEKAGPLYLNIGPWGPYTSTYVAYLLLLVCGWSLPITIPNQSHVAALVAKKKQALCI